MPHKVIELTVELLVHAVSCPGVWLCPEGPVSLSVFALGCSYRTARLPPLFPLAYNDLFYFRKRFRNLCTLKNLHCVLKEETIYCELVQWPEGAGRGGREGRVLAQYLGSLNELLFPPHTCSNDAVDLLMRTTKIFPGILSPKIEVSSKIRVDEVWEPGPAGAEGEARARCESQCSCRPGDAHLQLRRQKPVCHSLQYHKSRCHLPQRCCGKTSQASRCTERSPTHYSCGSDRDPQSVEDIHSTCMSEEFRRLPTPCTPSPAPAPVHLPPPQRPPASCRYDDTLLHTHRTRNESSYSRGDETLTQRCGARGETSLRPPSGRGREPNDGGGCRRLLESRYAPAPVELEAGPGGCCGARAGASAAPCVCEICRRYHMLFHTQHTNT